MMYQQKQQLTMHKHKIGMHAECKQQSNVSIYRQKKNPETLKRQVY